MSDDKDGGGTVDPCGRPDGLPTDPVTRRQINGEVRRVVALERVTPPRGGVTYIPAAERVAEPDNAPAVYRSPPWLAKTASAAQVAELDALLGQLRELNRRFEGERVKEVEAYFAATGEHRPLTEGFTDWCDGYVRRRVDRLAQSPQHGPLPFHALAPLYSEMVNLFGTVTDQPGTVNALVLNEPNQYAAWLGYVLLSRTEWPAAYRFLPDDAPEWRAINPDAESFNAHGVERGYFDNGLTAFLTGATAPAAPRPPEEWTHALNDLAYDIQVMRPWLVSLDPWRSRLEVPGGRWAAWRWHTVSGIAILVVAPSEPELAAALRPGQPAEAYLVRHDGLLAYHHLPWRTAAVEGDGLLGANYAIIERFRDRLFGFFDRNPLAREGIAAWAVDGAADEPATAGLAAWPEGGDAASETAGPSLADDAVRHLASGTVGRRRLQGLRFQPFEKYLERLGCVVREGKGSEVTVHRDGHRMVTLGRHKRNREVFPVEVRRVLKRVGISEVEWRSVVGDTKGFPRG